MQARAEITDENVSLSAWWAPPTLTRTTTRMEIECKRTRSGSMNYLFDLDSSFLPPLEIEIV